MEKIRMFSAPHKALRRTMAAFSTQIGQTNFRDEKAVRKLKENGNELIFLLSSHAETEEKIILSALEVKFPGSSEQDRQDHIKIEKRQKQLEDYLNMLSTSVMADEAHDFYLTFALFHSRYLEHIDEEETVTQKQIWQHFSDEEQLAMRTSIIAKMDPDVYATWLKHMIPAQNENENQAMLGALRMNMQAAKFHSLMEKLGKDMDENDFLILGMHLSALALRD